MDLSFIPRGTGLHGLGEVVWGPGAVYFQWTVMDEVEGPDDLELGEYGLSFRWDNLCFRPVFMSLNI